MGSHAWVQSVSTGTNSMTTPPWTKEGNNCCWVVNPHMVNPGFVVWEDGQVGYVLTWREKGGICRFRQMVYSSASCLVRKK